MASARIINKKNAPMVGLALFYLAFLGGEFLFDERVGALAGASAVALAESVVVGISVAGFLLYPVMLRLAGNRARNVLYVAGGVSAACLVALGLAGSLGVVYAAGGVGLLCLGLVGAAAHDAIARADEPVGLGAAVGAAYAAGVLLQVGLQLATSAVVLVVLAAIYVLVFLGLERGSAATEGSAADLGSGLAPAPAPLDTPADSQTSASLDPAQKLSAFVEAFGLTDREAEVLGALTTSDANMQELAQELYISRSALYRHISSICKRVGVENRQALLLRYFAWEPDARD